MIVYQSGFHHPKSFVGLVIVIAIKTRLISFARVHLLESYLLELMQNLLELKLFH